MWRKTITSAKKQRTNQKSISSCRPKSAGWSTSFAALNRYRAEVGYLIVRWSVAATFVKVCSALPKVVAGVTWSDNRNELEVALLGACQRN